MRLQVVGSVGGSLNSPLVLFFVSSAKGNHTPNTVYGQRGAGDEF